jgi:class 3 adenylate cyclase
MPRSDLTQFKGLIKQAETYHAQGLLDEAREKYLESLRFVQGHQLLSETQSLIDAIRERIQVVEKDIEQTEQYQELPDLPQDIQDFISRAFSFSENKDIATVEGAVALAGFGQYERALEEFDRLLEKGVQIQADPDPSQLARHFNTLIRVLRDSYTDIRDQNAQLLRYARDVTQYYQRLKEEEQIKDRLSKYVGKNLFDRLADTKGRLFFQNERKEITVLFADIRGFTSLSERMTVEGVVSLLNQYFSLMVDIVFRNDGVLDKFVGDELMAVFGLIASDRNTPYCNAVKTAIEIQQAAGKLMKTRTLLKKEIFDVGIGINTGEAIVGNVGSANRMDYTVIGDCVNMAARFQQVAEGGEIIIGEKTYQHTKDLFRMKKKGRIKLKNKSNRVVCYQVLG